MSNIGSAGGTQLLLQRLDDISAKVDHATAGLVFLADRALMDTPLAAESMAPTFHRDLLKEQAVASFSLFDEDYAISEVFQTCDAETQTSTTGDIATLVEAATLADEVFKKNKASLETDLKRQLESNIKDVIETSCRHRIAAAPALPPRTADWRNQVVMAPKNSKTKEK